MRFYSDEWVAAFNEAVADLEADRVAAVTPDVVAVTPDLGADQTDVETADPYAAGGPDTSDDTDTSGDTDTSDGPTDAAGTSRRAGAPDGPDGDFRLLQVVHDDPEGTVRIGLASTGGRVTMTREPPDEPAPQVTLSVGYADAAALSRGELEPARLIAAGRVKVRGDLSVLVGGQVLLAAVARRAAALSTATEY